MMGVTIPVENLALGFIKIKFLGAIIKFGATWWGLGVTAIVVALLRS